MCGAIPVVSKRLQPEEQELGYEYCQALQPCELLEDEEKRKAAAQRNWLRFVRRHSLVTELNSHFPCEIVVQLAISDVNTSISLCILVSL